MINAFIGAHIQYFHACRAESMAIRIVRQFRLDKAIEPFYQLMPDDWIYDIHCNEKLRFQTSRDFEVLDRYLKSLGFTGIPIYECERCHLVFRDWREENVCCPACFTEVSYEHLL